MSMAYKDQSQELSQRVPNYSQQQNYLSTWDISYKNSYLIHLYEKIFTKTLSLRFILFITNIRWLNFTIKSEKNCKYYHKCSNNFAASCIAWSEMHWRSLVKCGCWIFMKSNSLASTGLNPKSRTWLAMQYDKSLVRVS